MTWQRRTVGALSVVMAFCMLGSTMVTAHGVSSKDARFLLSLDGSAVIPLMYLGAKHMVTGYDHLLFLVGVIFFLYRLKDIVLYVSLFTIGHSLTRRRHVRAAQLRIAPLTKVLHGKDQVR